MIYLFILNLILIGVIIYLILSRDQYIDKVMKHLDEIENKFLSRDMHDYWIHKDETQKKAEENRKKELAEQQRILDEERKEFGEMEEV